MLLCIGLFAFKLMKDNTTLSFSFVLDGKPLPVGTALAVQVDGQPFISGLTITPGSHKLTADLQIAEPFERRVWVFFGNKNLGVLPLDSTKGSLLVSVNPSPASVILRRGTETVGNGDAPLTVEKLPLGNYELEIKRGEYKETRPVKIEGRKRTEAKIDLNLGGVNLSSDPADAEFQLSGNGRQWDGKLPILIDEVPGGDYRFTARRKGWEVFTTFSVSRGVMQTNKIEFTYGSIDVASDPTGLTISTNGVEVGKTPTILRELRPGSYVMTVTDGENDLSATISVGPKEKVKKSFVFRYGVVQLASTPAGAIVIRKGKEAGKTPLKLERIPAGETAVALKLDGYVTTNFALHVVAGETANLTARLISERYIQAMKQAREDFAAGKFAEAQKSLAIAEGIESDDKQVKALGNEVSFKIHCQKAEALLSSNNQFSEALVELAKADKFHPDSEDVLKLRQKIEKQKLERFNGLVQKAFDSISRGLLDETVIQLVEEADGLYPNNPRIAELRGKIAELREKMAPALRERLWNQLTQRFTASSFSRAHVWTFGTDLAGARSGIDKALKELLGPWKVKSEEKPSDQTIALILEPKGILGQLSFPHPCVLMVSYLQDRTTEVRSRIWVYPPNPQSPGNAQQFLETLDLTLFNSLKRQMGQAGTVGQVRQPTTFTVTATPEKSESVIKNDRSMAGVWTGQLHITATSSGSKPGNFNCKLEVFSDSDVGMFAMDGGRYQVKVVQEGHSLRFKSVTYETEQAKSAGVMRMRNDGGGADVTFRMENGSRWIEYAGTFYRR